jgi:hypothetical protein
LKPKLFSYCSRFDSFRGRFDKFCAPSILSFGEALGHSSHFSEQVGISRIVSGHALGLLPERIGNGAFIKALLTQYGRHGMPQPVDGEAGLDFALLFKLDPERVNRP